ncbi:SOSS complex subunit B1-like isoform X1 [Dreissena polymorpha]|nr:SOSS complex subunit B1-like isoform X1 [Dreissena polymorpha]XP_052232442.1 SOSS complex subunit B1-like isoform X2 [Dreissena polymorpha]XP_052232443.1 SOSS complex subunit B1-like isoform X3 [Dreissena polymorpha]XP_052232444.1 SOSS complex subunit B1-like isoform X1 [Dreissena polymorpha]
MKEEIMSEGVPYAYIKDLKPAQKNLNVIFIVLEVGPATRTKDNHTVRSCRVADKTGSINISIWDDIGELVMSGDICRLVKGYTNIFKNCLTLYAGKNGGITKIGEFCMLFSELPNMSEPNPEYANMGKNKEPLQDQRKSPTEVDGGGAPAVMSQLNNPGGRGSPPVRPNSGQTRPMGNGQNFNQNRQPRAQGNQGPRNYAPHRAQQQFPGNNPQSRMQAQGQGSQRGRK